MRNFTGCGQRLVLIVEDSEFDALLVTRAFQRADATVTVVIRSSGEDALAFLSDPGELLPDLVLVDLAMPGLSGHDVIAAIRADHSLARMPIIVLTASHAPDDIRTSYENRTNAYVIKPADVAGFAQIARAISQFWFRGAIKFPGRPLSPSPTR